jgi:hypothetical protein
MLMAGGNHFNSNSNNNIRSKIKVAVFPIVTSMREKRLPVTDSFSFSPNKVRDRIHNKSKRRDSNKNKKIMLGHEIDLELSKTININHNNVAIATKIAHVVQPVILASECLLFISYSRKRIILLIS